MKVILFNRDETMHMGGDSVQVRETEKELNKLGITAKYEHSWDIDLNKEGYDLAHLFHINFGWTYNHFKLCQKYNKPYLVTAIFYPFEAGDMNNAMMLEVIREARRIIFMSNSEKQDLLNWFGEDNRQFIEEKSVVIPNGVSDTFKSDGEKYLFPNSDNDYVMTAGRWTTEKGLAKVMGACKELGLPVLGVGQIADINYYNQAKTGYPEAVCLDRVDQETLANMYRGAKVYVCASNSERNNLCLLEAGACGCNLVASSANRGNEWYGNMLRVFDYKNYDELKRAISEEYSKERDNYWVDKIPRWSEVAIELKKVYEQI